MKIYLISFNGCDYDQYGSFLFIGENKDKVIKFLKRNYLKRRNKIDWDGGFMALDFQRV